MDDKCCGTCKHWTTEWQADADADVGQCIRFPPVIFSAPADLSAHEIQNVTAFPVLSYVRLCGEWASK